MLGLPTRHPPAHTHTPKTDHRISDIPPPLNSSSPTHPPTSSARRRGAAGNVLLLPPRDPHQHWPAGATERVSQRPLSELQSTMGKILKILHISRKRAKFTQIRGELGDTWRTQVKERTRRESRSATGGPRSRDWSCDITAGALKFRQLAEQEVSLGRWFGFTLG